MILSSWSFCFYFPITCVYHQSTVLLIHFVYLFILPNSVLDVLIKVLQRNKVRWCIYYYKRRFGRVTQLIRGCLLSGEPQNPVAKNSERLESSEEQRAVIQHLFKAKHTDSTCGVTGMRLPWRPRSQSLLCKGDCGNHNMLTKGEWNLLILVSPSFLCIPSQPPAYWIMLSTFRVVFSSVFCAMCRW